ncbi:MAG: DNA double-strand break repair nuclease NurA [Gemmatimonadetes bacterium]|nr:MAG: DNA double-strand break repair nuclease NurA [Gemmatimonadota bacterium]
MLDLVELQRQIQEMDPQKAIDGNESRLQLDLALQLYEAARQNFEAFQQRVNQSKTTWLIAQIDSSLDTHRLPKSVTSDYTLFATDGSQIFPSHHEIVPYFLINIGNVVLQYGASASARLWSAPHMYYRQEDLQIPTETGSRTISSDEVSARRGVMELEALWQLAAEYPTTSPRLAIADGTLIMWYLEEKRETLRLQLVDQLRRVFDQFETHQTPIFAYKSDPRHSEFIKSLRVYACPVPHENCQNCQKPDLPPERECAQLEAVRDARLFAEILRPGERSAIFSNAFKPMNSDSWHPQIDFFYLNVGQFGGMTEIARLEFPHWMSHQPHLIDLIHAVTLDQVEKGFGYPLALIEAHEQAVVRGPDRELFYQLIENTLLQKQIHKSPTRKALSKQRPTR